jgi:hypothetical protein
MQRRIGIDETIIWQEDGKIYLTLINRSARMIMTIDNDGKPIMQLTNVSNQELNMLIANILGKRKKVKYIQVLILCRVDKMPYIKKELRELLDDFLQKAGFYIKPDGTLNYGIFKLMRERIKKMGMSYAEAIQWLGELEACKLEIYRRIVAPYEDEKIKENGDVE